jgi:hypothetical protein
LAKEDRSEDSSTGSSETREVETNAEGFNRMANMMGVNMVFAIPVKFRAPEHGIVELVIGTERTVFEKPGEHMKPLFIQGHLDGTPVGHMLVDGGERVNIMPLSVFNRLDHGEGELKRTNLSLSGFVGEPTEANSIVCKELTIGSKTVPTTFFVVDVKGRYNVLL